ncbi:hypothetical protein BBFGKLBO_00601 [Synechococcus sp. CBW1107]|nr:hypothetical protein BBFGKLBO_00601 [Synechococcus sp. CBW1107]
MNRPGSLQLNWRRPHEPGDLGEAVEQQLQQSEAGQAGGRQEGNGVEHDGSVRGPA